MSTQQDIYAAGFENRPLMLNKENYVPWSSRLLCYAKSRPNGKLIYNSIMNGPYVRRMKPELGDPARTVPIPKTFHEQTDDKLTEAEIKQMEADDQATQTILLGLPEDIYAAVDISKLFNEWERFTSTDGESIESYYHHFSKLMNDFKRNKHFSEKIASNIKFLNNLQLEWSRHVTIVHHTKDLHTTDYIQLYDFLKYNQKEVDELRAERLAKTQDPLITQPGMNLGQDNQMQMVGGNGGNKFRQYVGQNVGNQVVQNAVQNPSVQNVGNQIGVIVVLGIAHQNGNGNGVAARADGNENGNNDPVADCSNRKAGIQLQAEEFDLMAAAADLDEIEEVNANCILMANLQQASTSGTQTYKAPVYDSDGSAEVQLHDNCYDDEIFNMFTQEEQYNELLEPILEPHQVPQNDSNVISEVSSMEQGGGTIEQHYANVEETRAYHESLFHNLAAEVENVNLLRAQLFEKVSDQKDTSNGMSTNTKFANQLTKRKPCLQSLRNQFVVRQPNAFQSEGKNVSNTQIPQKVDKTKDLLNPITSNSVPTTKESKVVDNDKVIAPGMFRINPFKNHRVEKFVPNKSTNASVRTNPITVSQPLVITRKVVNSDSHGFSSTGVDITTKTRRPQPRSNTKNDRVPYESKYSHIKNKEVDVEDHPRNLMLSKNKKLMSSEYNNIKLAIQNDKS
ncbi:hypothetical protein Tco_0667773 [Tanacetum coccineum]